MSASLSGTQTIVVDMLSALVAFLDGASNLPNEPPSLFIDLEGTKLGRHGTISIISLYIAPQHVAYLVDVNTLGASAFSETNDVGSSLKTLLESADVRKVFFDVRNDSDALFSLYQISVSGIEDLQLMELASRSGRKDFVAGLAKCIDKDCPISVEAKTEWRRMKDHTTHLFDPRKGGSYEVLDERPMKPEIIQYCAQDVALLSELYTLYSTKLRPSGQSFWRMEVKKATEARIKLSQSPRYDGQASDKARGPWDEAYIDGATEAWNEEVLFQAFHGDE